MSDVERTPVDAVLSSIVYWSCPECLVEQSMDASDGENQECDQCGLSVVIDVVHVGGER